MAILTNSAVNHVGIAVCDLAGMTDFYRDLLGMRVAEEITFDGPQAEALLGIPGAAGRIVKLRAANVRVELFAFSHPRPAAGKAERPVSDFGINHLCLQVESMEDDHRRLVAAGIRFHCDPIDVGHAKVAYVRDPEGNVVELIELTNIVGTEWVA